MTMRLLSVCVACALCACAGCFSTSSVENSKTWTVDAAKPSSPRPRAPEKYVATRLGAVTVLMPYDRAAFAVRRADGTLAEDPLNRFAAAPAALLRAPTLTALDADGRFGVVLNQGSIASAPVTVEVTVSNLSLDCREEGVRRAVAALRLDVVSTGTRASREVVASAYGEGSADAASGDYSAAFTLAFDQALQTALTTLHARVRNPDLREK